MIDFLISKSAVALLALATKIQPPSSSDKFKEEKNQVVKAVYSGSALVK